MTPEPSRFLDIHATHPDGDGGPWPQFRCFAEGGGLV